MWWEGPTWLSQSSAWWPRHPDIDRETALPELTPSVSIAAPVAEEYGLNFSSYTRLCRVTAWIQRFINRSRQKLRTPASSFLTTDKLVSAETTLLKLSQTKSYSDVLFYLQDQGKLPVRHPYAGLALFLGEDGLLRVGGRLGRSCLSKRTKHPVLLSIKSNVVKLMVRHTHVLILHAGAATAMAWLSKRYYIPQIKRLLKSISRNCTVCQKTYARTSTQMMADLPAERTTPFSPFSSVGIDYAGPFSYKEGNQRKPTIKKGYIAVYVYVFVLKQFSLIWLWTLQQMPFLHLYVGYPLSMVFLPLFFLIVAPILWELMQNLSDSRSYCKVIQLFKQFISVLMIMVANGISIPVEHHILEDYGSLQ